VLWSCTNSAKNEREAPGFRHGEESGSDDRRLKMLAQFEPQGYNMLAIKNNHLRVEAF